MVVELIPDGQRLLEKLAAEGINVSAAARVKESDGGFWYLYIASSLVGKGEATLRGYGRLNDLVGEMLDDGSLVDRLEVKLISRENSIAKAMTAARGRRPADLTGVSEL